MPVPKDADAFIAAAERGINQRDLEATVAVYSADVHLESLTDGAFEAYSGADEVRRAWAGYLEAMGERGFLLRKTLVGTSDDTLVNEWTGSLGGRTESRGIEYWVFDDDGKVREHRLYSFLNVRPSTSLLQRLRLAFNYPLSALSFLRAQGRPR